jgi:hypothetical protein
VVSLVRGDRPSTLTLALVLSFLFVPGWIVYVALMDLRHLAGYSKFLFIVSLCGLVLLPVTLTREFLKFLRDRRADRRRRRRRPCSDRLPILGGEPKWDS